MTSSSSLYGTTTTQNSSSSNSTSLYGEAGTPIPDSSGNVIVRGDLYVLSGNILTTATTGNIFPTNATTINLGLAATAVNIGAGSGTTTINNALVADSGDFGNITIAVADDNTITTTTGELRLSSTNGDVKLEGIDTLYTDTTSTFNLLNLPTTVFAFRNATTLSIGEDTGTTTINNNLTVDGTDINIAQGTSFLYSEAGDRVNRPTVQSTSGNSSGFRVTAPNATTSAQSNLSVFATNDIDNGEFLSLRASGSTTAPFSIRTGKYTAGVLGASGEEINFIDNTTTYASVNPAGPTNSTDLTTKAYVDAIPNITYTIDATSATGGANFNLTGSDASTDTIKFASGTGITVSRTDANTITITNSAPDTNTTYTQNISSTTGGANLNLVGSDSTTDTVKFANGTGVTVSYTDASTATVAIGQPVATTDAVTFASVDANGVVVGGIANTISGAPLALASNTAGGGSVTTTATDSMPGGGTGQLTVDTGFLTYTHTDGALVPGVTGTWSFNPDGTTNFPSYKFPYADGTANQVLTTDGAGNVTWALPGGGGSTFGNVSIGVDSDQTISTTSGNLILQTAAGVNAGTITMAAGVNGDITLAPNGTGKVVSGVTTMSDDSRVFGNLIATPNTSYNPPTSALSTLLGTNGLTAASSAGGAGYGAAIAVRYHSGDTTAGTNSAAAINMSGSSGTSTSPGGAATNQVLGSTGFDGYTAGTNNNFASQIATMNQGGGTASLVPLQAQGYARQAFTNSTVLTTAVTGASGTGSVATLTFTTQNTSPYGVGQSVTVAGMTPSGYNGTYTITAVSTSSISYANTTTGFTSGGTIAAANTVTAAGAGFRVRGYANSTNMTSGNRFNFMDLTASALTFKTNAYTFANEVITGSTLTATNYMTLGATTGSVNQNTFTIKNTAGTTTYATFASGGIALNNITDITGAGLSSIVRTTVGTPGVAESRPSFNIRLSRSDQAAPNDQDATGFRYQLNGSNLTAYSVADMSARYRTAGDNEWNLQLANGDQTTGTFSGLTTLQSKITATTIRAGTASGTPGGSSVSDVAIFTPTNTTVKSDAVTLQTNAGVALVGNAVSYNRVYGQWEQDGPVNPVAATTSYVFPIGTAIDANIASVGSTSRIIPGAAGKYNLQFSLQWANGDNTEHTFYVWLRKNGTNVANSTGDVTCLKSAKGITGWNYIVSSANTTDYWELAYQVTDTNVTFPYVAAQGTAPNDIPACPALITTLVPVGA